MNKTFIFQHIKIKAPTLEEYTEQLRAFEWWYFMTDDGYDHYDQSRTKESFLKTIGEQCGPEYLLLFYAYKETKGRPLDKEIREKTQRRIDAGYYEFKDRKNS